MATGDLMGQLAAGLLILDPHVILLEPHAVVRPVGANNGRDLSLVTRPASHHGLRPTSSH